MKIRKGFVSNSSSSSFVVAFDALPKSVEELKELLFGDEEVYMSPFGPTKIGENRYAVLGWETDAVAATVWADLQRNGVLNEEDALDVSRTGLIDGADYPDYPDYGGDVDSYHRKYDEFYKKRDEASLEFAKRFLEKEKDKVFVQFHYSDNDGDYHSALEHGTLFDRLPHIRINQH